MTASPAPLTEAEAAVVAVLTGDSACSWHHGCDVEDCYGPRARAIVAAVEPHLTIAALEAAQTAIEQFSARKRKAGHRRDAVGIDEAAELVLDQLRTLRTRQSLSLPASKETPK